MSENIKQPSDSGSVASHCSSAFDRWASVGDVIECEVQNPFPQMLRVKLNTPEACAYGNELIAAGRWRKVEPHAGETGQARNQSCSVTNPQIAEQV